ncbi:amidohydrolase family protein [Saccharopolyspora sp. CA-218241]|uniref:amidohydrolase family protein n=1 Tax=Saccharopolyspora sp. CA-218241 TaxID=3240027 RepID=UPI003D953F9B
MNLAHRACRVRAPYRVEVGAVFSRDGVERGPHVLTVLRDGRWTLRRAGPAEHSGPPVAVSLPDAVVAPALTDAHVHPHPGMDFGAFLRYGIARIRDLGSLPDAVPPLRGCAVPVPEVVRCGALLDSPGPPRFWLATPWRNADDLPGVLDAAVRRDGSWLKLYAGFPPELYGVVVPLAHERGLRVALHPAPGTVEPALRAGVDEIEHLGCLVPGELGGPRGTHHANRAWAARSPEDTWPVLPPGTVLCPTLVVQRRLVVHAAEQWAFTGIEPGLAAFWRRMAVASRPWTTAELRAAERAEKEMGAVVRRLVESGVRLVVGSDTPNPGVLPGAGLWEELNLLGAAGLDPARLYRTASVTGEGLATAGTESLAFLPLTSFNAFLRGHPYPVEPATATLFGGCLFTPPAASG